MFRSTRARERPSARMWKFKKRKILEIAAMYVRVHSFFCTYSTSIHISRRLYFSFLSLRLFFPMVGCPTFLFCSFSLVPFPFSLLPSLLSTSRKHKRVRVFPIRFRPQLFFSSFSLFFSICLLSLALMYLLTLKARAHIQKKKTEDEEDEHTYTIEKKECCCR